MKIDLVVYFSNHLDKSCQCNYQAVQIYFKHYM